LSSLWPPARKIVALVDELIGNRSAAAHRLVDVSESEFVVAAAAAGFLSSPLFHRWCCQRSALVVIVGATAVDFAVVPPLRKIVKYHRDLSLDSRLVLDYDPNAQILVPVQKSPFLMNLDVSHNIVAEIGTPQPEFIIVLPI